MSNQLSRGPGSLWTYNTPLDAPESLTGLSRLPRAFPSSSVFRPHGYDYWFCDFNNAWDFSLSAGGVNGNVAGSTLSAESIPRIQDTAGTTGNATAPNLNVLTTWTRTNIGAPTTLHFWGPKALGNAGNNDRESAIRIGVDNINTGFVARQQYFTLNGSTAVFSSEYGFIVRLRRALSAPTSAGFFGFNAFTQPPLTTAGAMDASATYQGFHVDTAGAIHAVMGDLSQHNVSAASGVALSTNYFTLELRAFVTQVGGFWVNGDIEFAVNGAPVRGVGPVTFSAAQFANVYDIGSTPMALAMAAVNTVGGGTDASYEVDYIGAWRTRGSTNLY